MARSYKRDGRGRFATVDSRGNGSAKERRFEERAIREADREKRRFAILTAEREVDAARAEKKRAVKEFNQMRRTSSVESPVWEDFEKRVNQAIARLSAASIELNRLKGQR